MSGSTTLLDLLSSSQSAKEDVANVLFNAMSQGALFGKRDSTTTGLTWGYYGGNMTVGGVVTAIANGTVALTNGATNYVEATTAGVVSANTTAFTSGRIALYTVVTSGGGISTWVDYRTGATSGVTSRISWRVVTDSTTLVLADAGNGISLNKSTAAQITIPPASSVAFSEGDSVLVLQRGAGNVEIVGGSLVGSPSGNVTILNSNEGSPSYHATRKLNSVISLINLTTDIWIVTGDTY